MKQEIKDKIIKHGESLRAFFGLPQETDPIKLCKKLRRLEIKSYKLAVMYCNGEIEADFHESQQNAILMIVQNTLNKNVYIFINTDPRGYSLKVKNEYVKLMRDKGLNIPIDLGDYGIIAPDLSGE